MSPMALPTDAEDHRMMARALSLAERGFYSARPNPRVGCVIVNDGAIVGEGFHYCAGEAHAEINALRDAQSRAAGSTAYVTLEPCSHHGRTPPCVHALIKAGVARVVCAMEDPNPLVAGRGAQCLRESGIDVRIGIMATPAASLNRGFVRRMRHGAPFVTLKLAMTMDSKMALESGESQWITSDAARSDVQRLRASSGAILTGVGTVIADDPALTVRDSRFDIAGRQPLRVILDSTFRVAAGSKIFRQPGDTIVFTTVAGATQISGARVEISPPSEQGLELGSVLRRLGGLEINDLLVEAGPRLAGEFMRECLVDELVIYMAPKVFGTHARNAFELPSPLTVDAAPTMSIVDVRRLGSDLRLSLRPSGDN